MAYVKKFVPRREVIEAAGLDIPLDRGIPMPELSEKRKNSRYPWAAMKVGDSFLFPAKNTRQACFQAAKWHSRDGKEFCVAQTDEGYRCWRTE